MTSRKALHFVFKICNRKETINFFKEVLKMKVLRHEEFEEGCKATCNGPYDGKWSKSMIGYGAESNHFVMELTYNYGVGSYRKGNDFQSITVHSKDLVEHIKHTVENSAYTTIGDDVHIDAPGGYTFCVVNKVATHDAVQKVTLSCSNLRRSIEFWTTLCKMNIYSQGNRSATMGYAENQAHLELIEIDTPIDRATASGRIAFSCPSEQLPSIETAIKSTGDCNVLTPLVSLDTPGKATVQVVIVRDPDEHEICFVGEEGFSTLSQIDPAGDHLLHDAIDNDKSDEWFSKKGRTKENAV